MMIAAVYPSAACRRLSLSRAPLRATPKKLSYVISLMLITAIPMRIAVPYTARWLGLSQKVTGAWLGSIDTTGAIVASGTLVGAAALKISTILKFS